MSKMIPSCHLVRVFAFRGDRTRPFATTFQRKLDAEKNGRGAGPTPEECLLYSGHTGVSTDGGTTILGFNPDAANMPVWKLLNLLKGGERFHGVVCDDTKVFQAARVRNLPVVSFDVVLPAPIFEVFQRALDDEQWKSHYTMGFQMAMATATARVGWSDWGYRS